jgi:thymidylate synthase (FAD)
MPPVHVEVIGYTKFLGVPDNLTDDISFIMVGARPEGDSLVSNDPKLLKFETQDQGSDAARLIECAGRTCYDSYGKGRSSGEYHQHIRESGHGSVLEHAVVNYFIDHASRGLTHELVRHRSGVAISQRSTRYVNEAASEWIRHPLICAYLAETNDQELDQGLDHAKEMCEGVYANVAMRVMDWLERKGTDHATALKQARGAARGWLGNALESSMVWSANVRALRHVLEQRASPFADAEIRLWANRLYEVSLDVVPEFLSDYVKVECADGIGYGLTTSYRKL